MRQKRLKWEEGPAVYHCISRVVAGAFLFDEAAKTRWCAMLHQIAAFSGVEVLAFCVMSNHFHVLVRIIPLDRDVGLERSELLSRYRRYYALGVGADYPSPAALEAMFEHAPGEAARWKRRLEGRMGDLSEFMKTLKQRFTTWFNATHRRFGTLWAERFKSLLVEDSSAALMTVAAYIELNPVRAGLASNPTDYLWSSCRQRMAEGRKGTESAPVPSGARISGFSVPFSFLEYEKLLRWKSSSASLIQSPESESPDLADANAGDEGNAEQTTDSPKARIPATFLLQKQHRLFSRGIILGSPGFVEAAKEKYRGTSVTPKLHKRGRTTPLIEVNEESFLTVLQTGNRKR
jgi:REP element-mobilizing transposase RayT